MNITEEQYGKGDCIIGKDCPFYRKEYLTSRYELKFYMDYCLQGGDGCGLKNHHDISERVKQMQEGRKK